LLSEIFLRPLFGAAFFAAAERTAVRQNEKGASCARALIVAIGRRYDGMIGSTFSASGLVSADLTSVTLARPVRLATN
jgi:hypothetical protein